MLFCVHSGSAPVLCQSFRPVMEIPSVAFPIAITRSDSIGRYTFT